ncbi:MAG: hypothetical protein LDLANPLL_02456 [Turneriella sp.]|nr:hypothetical protein [Turneriella sp.]
MLGSLYSKLVSSALLSSVALHATAGTSFYVWMTMSKHRHLTEVELSQAPLVVRSSAALSAAEVDDDWYLLKKQRTLMKAPEQKKELPQEANVCRGKCPEAHAGFGEFIAASDAARKPKWVGNFITANDYPLVARQQGKDGRVVLSVIIDEEGKVLDAQLLEGAYSALNEVALAKIRVARFSPAYDNEGNAVACKVRLPIRFELK